MAEADFMFLSTDLYLGQYFAFPVPDSMAEPTIPPHSATFSGVNCALQRLTSDPNTYMDECGLNQDVSKALDLHRTSGIDWRRLCDCCKFTPDATK